jgi:hypothetical protein
MIQYSLNNPARRPANNLQSSCSADLSQGHETAALPMRRLESDAPPLLDLYCLAISAGHFQDCTYYGISLVQ